MSNALASAFPTGMYYSENMIETDTQNRANGVSSTIEIVNCTYLKNDPKITFYSVLNKILKILLEDIDMPDRVVLFNVKADVATFVRNIEKNDCRHIFDNQEFINYLGVVYDGLRKLIEVLSNHSIYDNYISIFDDYANLLHAWQTRLAIGINNETFEILSKLNSVFLSSE